MDYSARYLDSMIGSLASQSTRAEEVRLMRQWELAKAKKIEYDIRISIEKLKNVWCERHRWRAMSCMADYKVKRLIRDLIELEEQHKNRRGIVFPI